MNLEFGNIPQQEEKNTIILAAGTIRCFEDNFSYLRKINHICEARECESIMIVNFDQILSLISAEIKESNIKINEEQKIKIHWDTNKLSSNEDKVVPFIKPENKPEKNTIDLNNILYNRRNTICLLNINNDGIEPVFFKRKTFTPSKLKDKFKEGLNIIIQHQPSTKTMPTEYFIINTTYCIGKDIFRVHGNQFLGLCEDIDYEGKELIFDISSNQLEKIGTTFPGYYLESSFDCQKNSFIGKKQTGIKYIQNQEQMHKKALLIKRDKFYSKPRTFLFEFQNIDIKPDGSIVYQNRTSIPTVSCLKEQAEVNNIKFSALEKLQKLNDDDYTILDIDTMKEISIKEIINSKILGDFIIMNMKKNIVNVKFIEIDQLGFREIFKINVRIYDDSKDRRKNDLGNEFIKLPKNTLSHLVKDVIKDKNL